MMYSNPRAYKEFIGDLRECDLQPLISIFQRSS